jgi:NAD(P) transhydrogenase subunit beta
MFTPSADFSAVIYLCATVLFIFGLKGLSSPKTALQGNLSAMLGMALAIGITLMAPEVKNYSAIISGLVGGLIIGGALALRIEMTNMPQLVAILHSFVGLAAVGVGLGTFLLHEEQQALSSVLIVEIGLGTIIGGVTFTGSVVAFGKLQGLLSSNPVVFKGQHLLNLVLAVVAIGLCALSVGEPRFEYLLIMMLISFVLGVLIVVPIGGADMPVVVSMLNSYSGWAASATGFTLHNHLLISTGALVGSSGAILSYIMCKAMNRSFISVILGGFGAETQAGPDTGGPAKKIRSAAAEDVAFMLENCSSVIIIPGYGMAVSQAQHSIKELFRTLQSKGVEVKFAIHPVAGRMPGHMNVLLAEADIPYESVFELEDINGEFATCDVALIVGANDIVNPDAKTNKQSPLFGMPILEAYKAKQVFVVKRSMKAGYAGVDNSLFYYDNCSLVFGDAKGVSESLVNALAGGGH